MAPSAAGGAAHEGQGVSTGPWTGSLLRGTQLTLTLPWPGEKTGEKTGEIRGEIR